MIGVLFSATLLVRAFGIREKYSLHWYDSLIVAAAIEGECELLYSEDFEHGAIIEGVVSRIPSWRVNLSNHKVLRDSP